MTKQVHSFELAEVVTGLLIEPSIFGELDSPQKHQAFMLDIGRVIAEHCGGEVNWVNEADTEENYLSDQYGSPYLSVSPDHSLPSLNNNVWSFYDQSGWDDEAFLDIDPGSLPAESEIISKRLRIMGLLLSKFATSNYGFESEFQLKKKHFDYHVNDVLASIYNAKTIEGFDPLSDETDPGWFDAEEPCFDLITVRRFLPEEFIISADTGIFSEILVKSPSHDLTRAAEMAGLDAYRNYLYDQFTITYCSKLKNTCI